MGSATAVVSSCGGGVGHVEVGGHAAGRALPASAVRLSCAVSVVVAGDLQLRLRAAQLDVVARHLGSAGQQRVARRSSAACADAARRPISIERRTLPQRSSSHDASKPVPGKVEGRGSRRRWSTVAVPLAGRAAEAVAGRVRMLPWPPSRSMRAVLAELLAAVASRWRSTRGTAPARRCRAGRATPRAGWSRCRTSRLAAATRSLQRGQLRGRGTAAPPLRSIGSATGWLTSRAASRTSRGRCRTKCRAPPRSARASPARRCSRRAQGRRTRRG